MFTVRVHDYFEHTSLLHNSKGEYNDIQEHPPKKPSAASAMFLCVKTHFHTISRPVPMRCFLIRPKKQVDILQPAICGFGSSTKIAPPRKANSSPLKNDAWKTSLSVKKNESLFRGTCYPSSHNHGNDNGCISNSSSIPFKYSHYPLNHDYGRKSNLCNLSVGVPSIFSKLLTASGRFGDVVPRVFGVRHRKCCLGIKTFPWFSGVGDSNMVK